MTELSGGRPGELPGDVPEDMHGDVPGGRPVGLPSELPGDVSSPATDPRAGRGYVFAALLALLVGVLLTATAAAGASALLAGVAIVQVLLALTWVPVLRLPGRKGVVVVGLLAGATADAVVTAWPHSRLSPLLVVFALVIPVCFVHQLLRGAARVRVVASVSGIAVLIVAETALPAIVQIRHDFGTSGLTGDAALAVVSAAAAALAVGFATDLVFAAPRFDAAVPRGLGAVILSAAAGTLVGYLALRQSAQFIGGRGAFLGAATGALTALFAVAVAFLEHGPVPPGPVPPQSVESARTADSADSAGNSGSDCAGNSGSRGADGVAGGLAATATGAATATDARMRAARVVVAALVPICLVAPVALLLCVSIRA